MKKYFGIILCAVIAFAATAFVSCNGQNAGNKAELKSELDSLSYAAGLNQAQQWQLSRIFAQMELEDYKDDFIKGLTEGAKIKEDDKKSIARGLGLQMGQTLSTQMVPGMSTELYGSESEAQLDINMIVAAFKDVALDNELKIPSADAPGILNKLAMKAQEEKNKGLIEANAKFLEDNKTKEGVVALPSGLQYKVITEGTGAKPVATDKVKVHYHGTTIDGKVFDSSVERGEPAEFTLDRVIGGWTEGLQLMPVGSKYILYVPYNLGYGETGAGRDIGPYATLIFEVELLDILDQE